MAALALVGMIVAALPVMAGAESPDRTAPAAAFHHATEGADCCAAPAARDIPHCLLAGHCLLALAAPQSASPGRVEGPAPLSFDCLPADMVAGLPPEVIAPPPRLVL